MLRENKLSLNSIIPVNSAQRISMQTATSSNRDSGTLGLILEMQSSSANEAMNRLNAVKEESKEDLNPFEKCLEFDEYSPEEIKREINKKEQ